MGTLSPRGWDFKFCIFRVNLQLHSFIWEFKSIIKGGNVLRACNRCQCCQAAGQLFTERRNESDFGCQRSTVSLHSKSPDLFLEIATLSAT